MFTAARFGLARMSLHGDVSVLIPGIIGGTVSLHSVPFIGSMLQSDSILYLPLIVLFALAYLVAATTFVAIMFALAILTINILLFVLGSAYTFVVQPTTDWIGGKLYDCTRRQQRIKK